MRYENARSLMRSGDIIAFRHDNLASRIVRAATGSDYSHVGVVWPVAGRVMILEAVIPKIRIFPLSKLLPFYWVSLDTPLTNEAEEYALSRVGEEYSVMEAIRGYFGFTEVNHKWQCAEYVKAVLNNSLLRFYGNDTPSILVNEALQKEGILTMVTE